MTGRWVAALALALVVLALGVLELAGARADVGILSGTLPGGDLELLSGLAYVVAWFAVVLGVPVVGLALLLDGLCGRLALRWKASRRR